MSTTQSSSAVRCTCPPAAEGHIGWAANPECPVHGHLPPSDDRTGYVFPTWRAALDDAQKQIDWAYERRARLFKAANAAGLSYREIGEAVGLSAAGVHKIVGTKQRATLDTPVNT